MKAVYKFSETTYSIINAAMQVHRNLGNGFQEVIYQRALVVEFENRNLAFEREKEIPIFYDSENIGSRRVDFFVENIVLVEIKAVSKLENVHIAQTINYLEVFNLEIALLLNFGHTSLEFKRLINSPIKISN